MFCLGGFVGQSPLANHIRLFTTLDFSECLDIPEDAILNQEKVHNPGAPAGTYLWLKRDANIAFTVVDPAEDVVTFLQGPILEQNPEATTMNVGSVGAVGLFSTPICSIIGTILTSMATFTFVVCTRVKCKEYTKPQCPKAPRPIPPVGIPPV